ncbi:MAG TPA: 2,3-bisphosphoglycerate-independent phosphoglycerate mutase [Niabella sp.]|nr:2,3-bisphosphoglycerate-independent phosphoglycerate mutase [Niabella sp.]HOZ97395.1 2,3-bisphosphoglycerate-independent phosphoglycerate mutase [Niabella sp.]HQW15237.1 2,3-bisphosphoglycerate-independent phosphoglycerate mutase [Niabella sp.]HQX20295.1 2,3-bisphosphoglycerate-independent phosphoglycerate mutase [Niabella sp.]HQX42800.1 2,3-bisphosphoglycerate-independent phosphoglycerate mutase [Niabella sp.]
MSSTQKKAILIIMDGWGLGKVASADAIQNANTPFFNSLYGKYPHTTLTTFGEQVGLPEGQMGNSEVGHLNLGAGRIVYQELQRINVAVKTGELASNPELTRTIATAKASDKAFHLMGLVSDGGVHSHINHLKALLDISKAGGLTKVYVHAFTDGRDTDPKSGLKFIEELQNHIDTIGIGEIATVDGRYYAMDRDKRWERVSKAYDAMVKGIGPTASSAIDAMKKSYEVGVTDEFILPTVIVNKDNSPVATIQNGDHVLCFNFRTDRCREITDVLTQQDNHEYNMYTLALDYTTMTVYDQKYKEVHTIFKNEDLTDTIGEVIAKHGLKQIRIAETEKYPHVTFFFSGGRELEFEGESRILKASPKVATYDLQPEMSANELTKALIPEIQQQSADFICLNFANADMVGHTGVFSAAIKAVETVDHCVQQIISEALKQDYVIFLTADHGNSDFMINADGSPNTAHTLNLVPLFIIDNKWNGDIKEGKLGDLAPTILSFMKLQIPEKMTGNILAEA